MSLRKEKKFTFKIIGNIEGVYLPPLILLTLVENGITHGYRKNKEGEFCLTISKETDCIELILFNDGETNLETKKGTGTGIKYIEVRLQEVYKKNWIFEYGKVEGGYRVRLKFPQVSSYLI